MRLLWDRKGNRRAYMGRLDQQAPCRLRSIHWVVPLVLAGLIALAVSGVAALLAVATD